MLILILCLILQTFLCFKIIKNNKICNILAISLVIYIFIWYFLPGVLALVFSYEFISSKLYYDVSVREFNLMYGFESLALSFILFFLIKLANLSDTNLYSHKNIQDLESKSVFLVFLFYFIYLLYTVSKSGLSYLEKNSADLYGGSGGIVILNYLGGILFSAVVVIILMVPKRNLIFYIAFSLICFFSVISILNGSRIAFIGPIAIIVFRYFNRFSFSVKNFLLSIFVMLVAFYFVLPMSYVIGKYRGFGNLDSSLFTISNLSEFQGNYAAEMIFTKFDSFSAGVSLLKRGGGMGSAGLEPYYGSALVLIPRFVWPNRPVAGSSDGSIYGHPTRIVPKVQGADSDSYNVGVSSLAISVWQLGYLGFPVFVLSGTGFLLFVNRILQSHFIFNRIIGVYLLSIPTFHLLIASPDALLKQIALVLPILALHEFHQRFRRKLLGSRRLL